MPNKINTEPRRIEIANYVCRDAGYFAPNYDIPIFDPANRETDDYFVLRCAKHYREGQFRIFCHVLKAVWIDRLRNQVRFSPSNGMFLYGMYETGDYMNAYLEVENDE